MFRRGGCHLLGIFAVALGARDPDRRDLSGRSAAVFGGHAADRLRLRLLPQIGKEAKR